MFSLYLRVLYFDMSVEFSYLVFSASLAVSKVYGRSKTVNVICDHKNIVDDTY